MIGSTKRVSGKVENIHNRGYVGSLLEKSLAEHNVRLKGPHKVDLHISGLQEIYTADFDRLPTIQYVKALDVGRLGTKYSDEYCKKYNHKLFDKLELPLEFYNIVMNDNSVIDEHLFYRDIAFQIWINFNEQQDLESIDNLSKDKGWPSSFHIRDMLSWIFNSYFDADLSDEDFGSFKSIIYEGNNLADKLINFANKYPRRNSSEQGKLKTYELIDMLVEEIVEKR